MAQASASGGPLAPEQACFDVLAYDLSLRVDPGQRRIDGELTMHAELVATTDAIILDLDPRLEVENVLLGDTAADWQRDGGRIRISPDGIEIGGEFAVRVRYGGEPRIAPTPPWKGGFTWAETPDGQPWIATSCQGEGADLWWPCKDHPSDEPRHFDIRVTVPEQLVCASNGVLRSDTASGDGWRTFHWHVANPINNYCVALNIAPYEVIEDVYVCVDGTELPVQFWVLPRHAERGRRALPEFLDHLRHMEETCGPYPFRNEKYGIAETPFLGMEHQTIIAYGNRFRRPRFNFDWLHHHEMSHEWWGNLVTCRDWKDMWIHEGIGTYMQALYIERKHGPAAYRVEMEQKRRTLANRQPIAPREPRDSREIYFGNSGNDIYYKGSWVMHTLRWVLGDETFFEALRRMAYPTPELETVTDGSQTRLVDTDEIREIAERVSGTDLRWFFDVYLHEAELPKLRTEQRGSTLHLSWEAPADLPFPMPVPIRIGEEIVRVEVGPEGGEVEIGDRKWEIDPDGWLLLD
jgi:aminopeptidase N